MVEKLDEALAGMIFSASGWRGIFAESGDEESASVEISPAHRIISAAAAKAFSDYLSETAPPGQSAKSAVIVGRDTRPTGEAIADAMIRALLAEGREVWYAGIAAAPEIMAFARFSGADMSGNSAGTALGFIYISASHNPIGHNGIKFGLTDGGVLQAGEAARLLSSFRSFMASSDRTARARALLEKASNDDVSAVYKASDEYKKAALGAYRNFTGEVISGFSDSGKQEAFFTALRNGIGRRPLGIAADFNGSARTVSIDRDFLGALGAGFYCINDKPGGIAHRIVPEGESLEPCRALVEELHRKDPSVILGYLPDCDGDRGNLVIWDEGEQQARSLEAQEVFALACIAELSSLVWTGELKYDNRGNSLVRAALAVNDPTSLRIDRIGRAFDVPVFRAEVGEANVVGLARKLRGQGYLVRILGEGSAGGTITHPSAVRDPIDTLGAILKLLAIRDGGGEGGTNTGLFGIWCSLSDQAEIYREDFNLADIIASLPAFVTTGAYTDEALLRVKTADHGLLKDRYQSIFLREWEANKETLRERYGISAWEAIAYNGTEEKRGISGFGEAGRGGLKIEFSGIPSQPVPSQRISSPKMACIWMRGSGTEPVFRVMADAEGSDRRLERFLIEWQRKMVLEADSCIQ